MIDKELFALLGNDKKYIYFSLLFMILALICNIVLVYCVCWIISALVELKFHGVDTVKLTILKAMFISLAAIVIRFFSIRASGEMKAKAGRQSKKRLRNMLYEKIVSFGSHSALDTRIAGLTQIAIEGIEQLDLYYSLYIPQFFYAMTAPIILFIFTVWIDWRVSLVLLISVPLIPISIVLVSKHAKSIFAKYWGTYIKMGDKFLDNVQGLKELKIFQADGRKHEEMNAVAEDFRKITMKVLIMQLASITIMDIVAYVGSAIGISLAIYGSLNWQLSPISTLFFVLIAVEFFLPLRAFGSAFHVAMNGASAGRKILTILNQNSPVWGEELVDGYDIKFDRVTFSYDGNRNVIKDMSFSVPKIGMTAIVGESGSGKSTIANLLLGEFVASEGDILIGGKKLQSLSRKDYYSKIAAVNYNSYIFNDSIRNNFIFAKENVKEQEIYEALKKVDLYDFVVSKGGIDYVILENANNLSGGQKQRLALAINLVADKNVYIFDEATSNIDIESENIIMKNIKELSLTKSIIIISHRLENVVNSDVIYYIEDGRIIERGNHSDLLNLSGKYATLYNMQKSMECGYLT